MCRFRYTEGQVCLCFDVSKDADVKVKDAFPSPLTDEVCYKSGSEQSILVNSIGRNVLGLDRLHNSREIGQSIPGHIL